MDGTATSVGSDADYDGTGGTLNFNADGAGNVPAGTIVTFNIPITIDDVVEDDETFTVSLGPASMLPSLIDTSDTGTVTIVNDDTDITIAVGDAVVDEGNDGDITAYTFTVTRAGLTTGTTTAAFAVTGSGTNAADADDFGGTFPSGMVSFGPGVTEQTITVEVSGDNDVEPDENFTVTLSSPIDTEASTIQIEPNASADGTIVNDDIDLTIAPAAAVVDEGNTGDTTNFTFTVTRSGDLAGTTTATYTVSGADVDAADFGGTLPTGTVTFLPTESTATITIAVSGDNDVEMDENFTVTLTDGADTQANHIVEIEPDASADGTIVNDDIDLTIAPDAAVVDEGNTGDTTNFTFTVTRSGDLAGTTTATYTVSGADVDAADFGGTLPTGTVTFLPTESTATITIAVSGDNDVEMDENFTVTLTDGADTQANHIVEIEPDASADGTIVNDDIDLTIAPDAAVVDEGNTGDTTNFTFTVTRSGDLAGTTTATYTVSGADVDAADFGGTLPTGTVTFLPTESTATITIAVSGDNDVEMDENFTVTLTDGADTQADHIVEIEPDASAVGMIVNDDIDLTIAPDAAVVDEGNTGDTTNFTFAVTRSGDLAGTTTATYTVSGDDVDAADFGGTLPTGTVEFAPDQETATITIQVSGDTDVELDEDFTVTLTNGVDTQADHIVEIEPDASAVGTIVNDDIDLTIAATTTSVDESNATGVTTSTHTFTVTRSGDTTGETTVDYAVTGSGANPADAADFGGTLPSGTVTFAPGDTTATIDVVVTGDNDVELDENFTVTLSGGSDSQADHIVEIEPDASADGVVVNDDIDLSIAAGPELFEDDPDSGVTPTVPAGFTAYDFVVTRTGDLTGTTTATYDVVGSGADPADADDFGGTFPSGTVEFEPNQETATIRVLVSEDSDVEADERFTVNLSSPSDSQANHIVEFIPDPNAPGSTAALGFIVDGDTFSVPFTITNNSGSGVDVVSFTLDISATGQNYDTASSGVPFTPVSPTDVDTGLVGPVTVPDEATTFTLNFTDFNSGESFQWDIDVDTVGQNNGVDGNQLIGGTATIVFSDGNVISGLLEAVPGNPDASQFNVTGVSLQVASADATILNDDIDLCDSTCCNCQPRRRNRRRHDLYLRSYS